MSVRVLAGDIGGTKSLLAVVRIEGEGAAFVEAERRYSSAEFAGLAEVAQRFVAEHPPVAVDAACFAVAGPVLGGECVTPNLPWRIRAADLVRMLGLERVALVNDFRAVGEAIPLLPAEAVLTLQAGRPVARGPIGVLGPGTGLGQAFLTWDRGWRVHDSEGGHGDFAPQDDAELGLLAHLRAIHGHVSYERVLSGPGLADIYRYVVASRLCTEAPGVAAEMRAGDPAAVVTRNAATDPASARALALFLRVLGAEAGNLALRVVATGGIYLAGGIAPRVRALLPEVLATFNAKGRLSDFLAQVPLHAILEDRAGLLGAAAVAGRMV